MYPHSLNAKDISLKASVVEQGMIWQCTTLYRVVVVDVVVTTEVFTEMI